MEGAAAADDAEEKKIKEQAVEMLGLFRVLPRLVVFDLDNTLWPFNCDAFSRRDTPYLFPHAKGILYALKEKKIDIAIASRSPTPDTASIFLEKLGFETYFVAKEIYPSWNPKTGHFRKIHLKTRIPYRSMLFFDDENRNVDAISSLGVTSVLVRNGIDLAAFQSGLTNFASNSESIDVGGSAKFSTDKTHTGCKIC